MQIFVFYHGNNKQIEVFLLHYSLQLQMSHCPSIYVSSSFLEAPFLKFLEPRIGLDSEKPDVILNWFFFQTLLVTLLESFKAKAHNLTEHKV